MKSPLQQLSSGLVWPLLGFALMVVISAGIAFFVSRKWGSTKLQREVIFTLTGFVLLLVSAAITFARLPAG